MTASTISNRCRFISSLIVVACSGLLFSCGDGDVPPSQSPSPEVTDVTPSTRVDNGADEDKQPPSSDAPAGAGDTSEHPPKNADENKD